MTEPADRPKERVVRDVLGQVGVARDQEATRTAPGMCRT
jgi:hypothetical protein